jgi:hypothetical protein
MEATTHVKRERSGFLAREQLAALLEAGRALGYRWQGPQLRDGAIVMATLDSPAALPWGTGDRQAPGNTVPGPVMRGAPSPGPTAPRPSSPWCSRRGKPCGG